MRVTFNYVIAFTGLTAGVSNQICFANVIQQFSKTVFNQRKVFFSCQNCKNEKS